MPKRAASWFPAFLALTAGLALPAPGLCDALTARLEGVKAKVDAGRHGEAFEELKAAELELWKGMTALSLREAVLIEEEPPPEGVYRPRSGNRYRQGEPVRIALEPVGYTLREEGELYRLLLATDFTVVDAGGSVYGGQRDFGRWEAVSRRPVTEFLMFFAYDLSGLLPGEYIIETVVRDVYSQRRLEVPVTVVITE